MSRVSHDLLVRHTITVGCGDKACAKTMRAYWLGQGAPDIRLGRAPQQNLPHSIFAKAARLDPAALVDLSEHRAGVYAANE
jgi:hypothetical protein